MCTREWRRGFTIILVLFGLATFETLAGRAAAQAPPSYASPAPMPAKKSDVIYTNKRRFDLPVKWKEDFRSRLAAICLWVKTPQTEWFCQETVSAQEQQFTFLAPQDGEYWFTVQTVEKGTNRRLPSDVSQVRPGLRVVIDTQPPIIEVQTSKTPEGDVFLKCTMVDQNPNHASLRLICRGPDGERILEPLDPTLGVFRVSPQVGHPVRVIGKDLCGNEAFQDVNLREVAGNVEPENKGLQLPSTVLPVEARQPGTGQQDPSSPQDNYKNVLNSMKNAFPPPDSGSVTPPLPPPNSQLSLPPSIAMATDSAPKVASNPGQVSIPSIPSIPAVSSTAATNRTILNSTQASVDYRIEQKGSSGIGKVHVYCTGDQGKTWQLLKEDVTKRSPVDVKLPGEGLFGISVVVTNGFGFGGTPPKSGDAPSYWIEVDTIAPTVQLQPIDLVDNSNALEIRWTASDKNLAAEPISLFVRTTRDGPWQPIARNVKNEGRYRWAFPRGGDSQFFFKVEAVDVVGNVAQANTPTPVALDTIEPRAVVTGVTGAGPGTTAARGQQGN